MAKAAARLSGQVQYMGHIHICVRDLDRTTHFYRDLVGLELISETNEGPTDNYVKAGIYAGKPKARRVCIFKAGTGSGAFLACQEHPGEEVTGAAIKMDQVGITHMAFTVDNLKKFTNRMLAGGAEPSGPADTFKTPNGRVVTVFFRDPDGILCQFDDADGVYWRSGETMHLRAG
jgi:catechol 2,3-dioxygenase-like lactoylglutathione lyase family enzyme